MNETELATLSILRRYIPEDFIQERLGYFNLLSPFNQDENWNGFIQYLDTLDIPARKVFIDDYEGEQYFSNYEKILKGKFYKDKSYWEWMQNFHECDIFPIKDKSRSRYDTINECLTILKYIDTNKPFSILDVGGGYGRNAEYFLKNYPNCKYYSADAFPLGTIMSEWYISHVIDSSEIRFLGDYNKTPKRFNSLAPSTDIKDYAPYTFVINIHSMDEMSPEDIIRYLTLFDRDKFSQYIYLKNHFETYTLASKKQDAFPIFWNKYIPHWWEEVENNICHEDDGIQITREKIFRKDW